MGNSIWATVQSNMPRNIFNFTVWYLKNSLATRVNLARRNLSQASDCSFCFRPVSLFHAVAGCKTYLNEGRFTWRHNSLQFIANSLQSIVSSTLYVDPSGGSTGEPERATAPQKFFWPLHWSPHFSKEDIMSFFAFLIFYRGKSLVSASSPLVDGLAKYTAKGSGYGRY